jgi:hypothetical protein
MGKLATFPTFVLPIGAMPIIFHLFANIHELYILIIFYHSFCQLAPIVKKIAN